MPKKLKLKYKIKDRKINSKTQDAVRKIWAKYTKKILEGLKFNLQFGIVSVGSKAEFGLLVKELEKELDLSYGQLNNKFSSYMQFQQTKHKAWELPEVDRTKLKENPEIYSTFVKSRNEHIDYFRKFPRYVESKSKKHVQKLIQELETSKEGLVFDAKKVAETAAKIEGISMRHAAFIARDQLGKFTGALNQAQDLYAGSKKYIWRTVGDNRVRHEHEERDGKEFYYSNPPAGGHPGQDYRCRCTAEAIFEARRKQAA